MMEKRKKKYSTPKIDMSMLEKEIKVKDKIDQLKKINAEIKSSSLEVWSDKKVISEADIIEKKLHNLQGTYEKKYEFINNSRAENFKNILLHVIKFDAESKKLMRLMIPFSFNYIFASFFEMIDIVVLGNYLGTKELTAYIFVDASIEVSYQFVYGFIHAEATAFAQVNGAGNYCLAGQNIQISLILYTLSSIPLLLWKPFMYSFLRTMGFEDEVAQLGRDICLVVLFTQFLEGFISGITDVLEIIGHEVFICVVDFIDGILYFCAYVIIISISPIELEIWHVLYLHLSFIIGYFIFVVSYSLRK